MVVKITKVKNHLESNFEFTLENFEKELNDLKRDYKINNVSNMEELIIEKIKFFHYLEEGKAGNPLVIKDSDKNGGIVVMLTGKDKEIVSYLINTTIT